MSCPKLIPLAPLHQPHNLAPIRTIMAVAPNMPQVVCFDTAFHRYKPHLAQAFGLPRSMTDEGVQRYGFHGLSYEYLVSRVARGYPRSIRGTSNDRASRQRRQLVCGEGRTASPAQWVSPRWMGW